MLFKDEKREQIKIKAKPGIVELANKVYQVLYPFATEANLDDLFEQMVTLSAEDIGLTLTKQPIKIEESKQALEEDPMDTENAAKIEIEELLGA